MTTTAHAGSPATVAAPRRTAVRVGRGVSWFFAAFLTFDAVIHILNIAPVVDGSRRLGFDVDVMPWIGVLELALVVLYVVPRTAVLGAVLLTGYLGGAFCAQLRIEAPVFSTLLFPIYVGVALWVGLWLRDSRVRNLV
jgi:hypothetical protein